MAVTMANVIRNSNNDALYTPRHSVYSDDILQCDVQFMIYNRVSQRNKPNHITVCMRHALCLAANELMAMTAI